MTVFEAKTTQDATTAGLAQLHLRADQAQIKVLDAGRRGFLGIGSRPARVDITAKVVAAPKTEPVQANEATKPAAKPAPAKSAEPVRDNDAAIAAVKNYLENVMVAMDLPGEVDATKQRGGVIFAMHTEKEALLIGKHGKTINALQTLAQSLFYERGRSRRWHIILNVGDYRERRERTLRNLAQRSAREVVASGKAVYLDPMPSFERKILHEELADSDYVETRSEGVDPRRFVVVSAQRR